MKTMMKKIIILIILVSCSTSKKIDLLNFSGKLIEIDGYRLHMFCSGKQSVILPTIIFESGVGNDSTYWINIQKGLSKKVRVCSYDRAGYGLSDEYPKQRILKSVHDTIPRSIDQNAQDLNDLLLKANILGPIILVGASYGALISLALEKKFPNKIQGLVLIDPHDDGVPLVDDLYTDAINQALKEKHSERYLRTMFSEWRALHSGAANTMAHPSDSIKFKPLTVISSDPSHHLSEGRTYLHKKTAKLSNQGKFTIATKSGHDIVQDRFDLIIEEIELMLEKSRGNESQKKEPEEVLKIKGPIKFFVDEKIVDYIRKNSNKTRSHDVLDRFCSQLDLGLSKYENFGYVDHRKNGVGGHFVTCQ